MAARRTTEKTTTTTTRSTRREAAAAPVEGAAPAKAGMNMADACMIVSAILLVVAFVLVDRFRGQAFGEGMFFKG